MINTKEIYNTLLSDSRIVELVGEDNIFCNSPNTIETFPCIIFIDDAQSDMEFGDNFPRGSNCSCQIHIYAEKLEEKITSSEIAIVIARVMNEDLWTCVQNGEVPDPDPDVEHRVLRFSKSIYNN